MGTLFAHRYGLHVTKTAIHHWAMAESTEQPIHQLLTPLCSALRSRSSEERHFTVCRLVEFISDPFQSQASEERLAILYRLVDESSAYERYRLGQYLDTNFKCDFLTQLPSEMSHHILSYLDVHTLLTCCKVSYLLFILVLTFFCWHKHCLGDSYEFQSSTLCNSRHLSFATLSCKHMFHLLCVIYSRLPMRVMLLM